MHAPTGQPPRRSVIVVLGGRSGTSALAGTLGLLGAALPRGLMGATPANPKGHFEPQHIADLHNNLLAELGSRWNDARSIDPAWFESAAAARHATELADVFQREYGHARLCVLKEPRMSRLLVLWERVFRLVGAKPVFLFAHRHPLDVVRSLQRRDGASAEAGLLFWLRGTLAAEQATRGSPRMVVPFDRFLADWRSCLAAIRRIVPGLTPAGTWADARVDAFLDPRLNHSRETQGGRPMVGAPLGEWSAIVEARLSRMRDDASDPELWRGLDAVRIELDAFTGSVPATGI